MPAVTEHFQNVSQVTVPGIDGRLGILPRHAPMIF
ncbi:MAG: hypothetical protein H6925_00820 [Holosporaceae bacterium]|nr:MAG: hypothetical protein H6925_00820 [Holosporaceae bacterium]